MIILYIILYLVVGFITALSTKALNIQFYEDSYTDKNAEILVLIFLLWPMYLPFILIPKIGKFLAYIINRIIKDPR